MTPDRWIVTALGLALIVFIVWFFWLKRSRGTAAALTSSGYQEIMVLVKGGYTPDTIVLKRGKPARLESQPRVRIAQIVIDYLAYGWSADEIHRQHPHLALAEEAFSALTGRATAFRPAG